MSAFETEILPPVRKTVFKHSMLIVGVYVIVGIFMMIAVFLAGGTTPKAIHRNYDSIAAADQMREALNALKNPSEYPEYTKEKWTAQFEHALSFEESNVTEIGEPFTVRKMRASWNLAKAQAVFSSDVFQDLRHDLSEIRNINERGMFSWVEKSDTFSKQVFFVTIFIFLFTVLIALYLADSLAVKIASPLRELSAVLKQRPEPGSVLALPPPETLEMRVLSQALLQLWERVSYLQTLNLEEISAQRNKLEAVLTSIEDSVLVLDNEEKIIHYNTGFSAALPNLQESLLGKSWQDLPTASENYLTLRSVLQPDVSSDHSIELDMKGKKRIFAARHRQINDESNQTVGNLYLLHDMTDAKQRDILRAEFIGVLSHELKTPLQSLGTASELLMARKTILDDEMKMLIETIFEDMNRIKGVVNEFIQVGVSDLHSLRLKIEPVPIQKLICQWIQPFQLSAKERSIKIETPSMVADDIYVRIDKVKFSWAVTNLLSNAIRVSPVESTVTVSVQLSGSAVFVEVLDQGPGIPVDVQRRMFEPYFQGTSKEQAKTSGFLGLGLAITKDVVEAHNGKIEYFTQKPKGSIFRITLPHMLG